MNVTGPEYTAQNECEISRNLNEIYDEDGSKKVQLNRCLWSQTSMNENK